MASFGFTLKFSLPEDGVDPQTYIEQLGAAGCDDALIGIGLPGRIALDFDREAKSAYEAISSAIADVKSVVPDARLVEATPDLVGLTDVAQIIGCTRQNMRKLMLSSGAAFPPPVHDGKTAIWRLSKVLLWLREKKHYPIEETLLDIAATNMQFNIAKDTQEVDLSIQKHIHALMS